MEENKILLQTQIELIEQDLTEAEAAVSLNPYFQWAKIIVTDDLPNLNNQRIPLDEFANIIKTGVSTPIKMTFAKVSDGHKEAMGKIIGTITQLMQEENKIVALAALWKKERPNDIEMLKDMYNRGTPPNVSWEISFAESQKEDTGVEALYGTALTGLAIVGNPAYAGRTAFVAMASKEEEESNVEELEQLTQAKETLEKELAEIKEKLEASAAELEDLRQYKKEIEDAKALEEKFAAVKTKFTEAGIEKDDEYFTTNKEKLLGLSEDALDFMIQELVSFAAKTKTDGEASTKDKTVEIPQFSGSGNGKLSPRELGKKLREKASQK